MTEKEFVADCCKIISSQKLKIFPNDFINTDGAEDIKLPGKQLIIGNEFFGSYEILGIDGASLMQAANLNRAKYLVYASRLKLNSILIPKDEVQIKTAVLNYHNHLEKIIAEIKLSYNQNFPGSKNFNQIINDIFRILNIIKY